MESLPNELLHVILSKCDTATLQIVQDVSRLWGELSSKLIASRIQKLTTNPGLIETVRDLRSNIPLNGGDIELVKVYESTLLSPSFQLASSADHTSLKEFSIKSVWKKMRCDCMDVDVCVVRLIIPMPTMDLLLVQLPSQFHFYKVSDPFLPVTSQQMNLRPYTYDMNLLKLESGSHVSVSIYSNYVAYQETPKIIMLFKVRSVDHSARQIDIERVRRVFFPIWTSAICLYRDKIFVVYTTGFIGCWDRSKDEITMSNDKLNEMDSPPSIYRCLNLIFIKQSTLVDPEEVLEGAGAFQEPVWSLLDGNSSTLTLKNRIPLTEWLPHFFQSIPGPPNSNDLFHNRLKSLHVLNNAFIAQIRDSYGFWGGVVDNYMVYIAKLKRDPQFADFESFETFKSLFHPFQSSQNQTLEINGSYTAPVLISQCLIPHISPLNPNLNATVYFMAIQKTLYESKRTSTKNKIQASVVVISPR